jgi:crotonyl-CoA reductase
MRAIRDAIIGNAGADALAGLALPSQYRAVALLRDEVGMFEGIAERDRDASRAMHVIEVQVPELAPGEALIAVMASSINYNTVWSAIQAPTSTFGMLDRLGRSDPRQVQPFHAIGSDLAGVVLRVGAGTSSWTIGDEVVAHCLSVPLNSPLGHGDSLLDPEARIWGYETNFGGLAELAVVRTNQLLPKPAHLTWEESAAAGLTNSTAYRQLVSTHGGAMKQGDVVLVWGATGGLGSYATQYALNGGAIPICVVSSPEKAALARAMGAEFVIDRRAEGLRFIDESGEPIEQEWKRFGRMIRDLTSGEDPDIVFEHPGRSTFGASVYVARRGGKIVTCASSTGYRHEYDNRYLWLGVKHIIGTHFANYREAHEANRLVSLGRIQPTLSRTYALEDAGHAAQLVHSNGHIGKIGVLGLSPEPGLGVRDQEIRTRLSPAITRFAGH